MIEIVEERCCGCGGCVCSCPVDALSVRCGVVHADESCIGCGMCVPFCPHGALCLPGADKPDFDVDIRPPKGEYDVVVVGGGPAGSIAARIAAEGGASVLLLEKRPVVGAPQLCGEGISLTGLTDVIPDIRESWVSAPIIGAVLVSPNGRRTVVDHPNAGYILDRRVFDRDLFALAAAAGARTMTSAGFIAPIWERDHIVGVRYLNKGKIREVLCRVIVAADGVESDTARALFPKDRIGPDRIHVAAQVVMSGVDVRIGFPEFHIGRGIAPGGYAWVFPKAEPLVNVGVGINPSIVVDPPKTALKLLERFIAGRFGGEGEIIEIASGNVPTSKRLPRIAYRNVLFVGDAGRLTDPVSGGGLANALLSGKFAGETVVESLKYKTTEEIEKRLGDYSSRWDRAKGKQLALYWRAKSIFAKLEDEDLEGICRFIDDRFGHDTFNSIDITGTIRSIIREKRLLFRLVKKLLPGTK